MPRVVDTLTRQKATRFHHIIATLRADPYQKCSLQTRFPIRQCGPSMRWQQRYPWFFISSLVIAGVSLSCTTRAFLIALLRGMRLSATCA